MRLIDADAFKQELKENYTFYGFTDLLNDFYVALDEQPTIEPIEVFEWCTDCKEYDQEKHCCHRWSKQIRQTVAELEEHYKPKRGEWIAVDSYSAFGGSEEQWYAHGNPTAYHYCSVCKEQVHLDEFGEEMLTNFCPNCGADMRKERK